MWLTLLTLMLTIFIKLIVGEDELVSVVVVYRHGDRSPNGVYPNDPYLNMSYWPDGFGQLTNKGKIQHYELGQWFRRRYNGFLSERYSREEIYVRSTDVDRTLMSAEMNLAGLYPPIGDQIWNQKINWQPIPIHTVPKPEDPFLSMERPCPRYDFLREELKTSPYFQEVNKNNEALYQYLQTYSGMEVKDVTAVKHIYSALTIELNFNYTIPEWTKEVYPDRMLPSAILSFAIPCFTTELARLKTGYFFGELVRYFKNRTENPNEGQKFLMYSAHDSTLANLLNAMQVFEYHMPPFASSIMFEQRRDANNNYYINTIYKNSTELQYMKLPGCEVNCAMANFESSLNHLLMTLDEREAACQFLPPLPRIDDVKLVFLKKSLK